MRRILRIDVCDYTNTALCNLYDSLSDVSGGAVDVFITSERNGWKELSFTIPSTVNGENGPEENYRLDYLIADYRLRVVDGDETDWYLLSENGVNHNAFTKNVEVKAGHISQILKTRQMNLEFSSDEGNNVGTCEQILTTILDGTGWSVGNVATFFEDNGVDEKVRSLNESSGTGALRMISDLCELFDAKAIYHGEGRTVDILPMNPFSVQLIPMDQGYGYGKKIRLEPGEIPTLVNENVLEFHYDKEAKGIHRTLNTDALITRMYAYGSYGDYVTGICDLKEEHHDEYTYTVNIVSGTEYRIEDNDGAYRYFTADETHASSTLIYSKLDYASSGLIWNETTQRAYRVYELPKGAYTEITYSEPQSVQNWMDCVLDFHYYDEVGLLTPQMLQKLGEYERKMPVLNEQAYNKSLELSEAQTALSNIGQDNTGFLKLKVKRYIQDSNESDGANLRIEIDTAQNDGVIYRSDYNNKYGFTWHTAKKLKSNGDPTSGAPSIVWILHNTNPVTYEQIYLKKIDERYEQVIDAYGIERTQTADYVYGVSEGRPEKITLWANYSEALSRLNKDTDEVYLFCTNSVTGSIGSAFVSLESAKQSAETTLKQSTVRHPIVVEDARTGSGEKTVPGSNVQQFNILDEITGNAEGYGWAYLYNPNNSGENFQLGRLFFCYHKEGDLQWYRAFCQDTEPNPSNGKYFYNTKQAMLYRSDGTSWELMDPLSSAEYKRLAQAFGTAWKYCLRYEEIYKGKSEYYTWTNNTGAVLPPGNYAMVNPYGFYWTFTTRQNIPKKDKIKIDVAQNHVYQDDDVNHIVETQVRQNEVIDFPPKNILKEEYFKVGKINPSTGVEENDIGDNYMRSISLQVHENTVYDIFLPTNTYAVLYDLNNNYKSYQVLGPNTTLNVGPQIGYVRFVCETNRLFQNGHFRGDWYARVQNYATTLFTDDMRYTILEPVVGEGTNKGINNLIALYPEYADKCYLELMPELDAIQEDIKDLENEFVDVMQDTLKETRWQEVDYVDGDEHKLYQDALDNLHEVSRPEATYEIDFLDLYSSHPLTEDDTFDWPDIMVTDAVHLVDPEIGVNLWGYVDKLNKCYDQPWKTTLEVNTKLTNMGQHSFTDIMTKIAEVAKESKNKQTIYGRAASLSSHGQLLADKLEGQIKANKTLITGDVGGWTTTDQGQILFESENGLYAMMLSGAGLLIADSKDSDGNWNWRTSMTGAGMTADEIVFGTMSGQRIEAHSITAEQVVASLGNELEIGSNVALTLFATKDGYRPAGSLDTTDSAYPKHQDDDSYIKIQAAQLNGSTAVPARIDVVSGGTVHIEGGDLELISNSTMDVNSGSAMNIKAGGSLNIDVVSTSDHSDQGTFTLKSKNLTVAANGNVTMSGTVTAYAGNIAGFTIKNTTSGGVTTGTAMYVDGGVSSLNGTGNGVYLGNDGLNVAGKFIISQNGTTAKFGSTNLSINAASGAVDLTGATTVTVSANSAVNIDSGKSISITTTGTMTIGNSSKAFTVGADTSSPARAYIYNGKSTFAGTSAGIYLGTDGINIGNSTNYVKASASGDVEISGNISATTGTIGKWVIGANSLYRTGDPVTEDDVTTYPNYVSLNAGTSTVYAIWAGAQAGADAPFSVRKSGAVKATNLTITGGSITIKDDGTTMFAVSSTGVLTAKAGTIGSWTIGTNYLGSGSTMMGSQIGMRSSTGTNTVFWAGNTENDITTSPFRVLASGAMYSTSGRIGGWYIGSDYIGNNSTLATSTVGMYSSSGVAFWAGGTRASTAKFTVNSDGTMTSTLGAIGGWTVGASTISSTVNSKTFTLSSSGTYAINANNLFTVTHAGAISATSGVIGPWTIADTGLSRTVANKGTVYLGTANYALNANNKFTVDYEGNVTIKSLSVDGQHIDFSTFNNAVSLAESGSWSGNTFIATVSLWGKINKSISIGASIAIENIYIGASSSGTANVFVTIGQYVNGVRKGEQIEYQGVSVTSVMNAAWAEAGRRVSYTPGAKYVDVPEAGDYGEMATLRIDDTYNAGVEEGESHFSSAGSRYWGYSNNGGATWNAWGSGTLYRKTN